MSDQSKDKRTVVAAEPGHPADKEPYIQELFDSIAPYYDLMNLVMTAGLWRYWQWVFRRRMNLKPGQQVLDVACGTGDLTFMAANQVEEQGHVTGLDLSAQMLDIARHKAKQRGLRNVELVEGNALQLPFEDNRFDAVITGFAMRNVADVDQAVAEMARVTRPGGRVLCLELSKPVSPLIRIPYFFYFFKIVPVIGRFAERRYRRQHQGALGPYSWLPESLKNYPDQEALAEIFRDGGLHQVRYENLMNGIVCIHSGVKP